MTKAPASPDVRELHAQKLDSGPFPAKAGQDFRVFLSDEVHQQIWRHAGEDTSVEICGVLVGQWNRDAEGPFVSVSASIRGEAAQNKFAEVTFTHETWSSINAEMDSKWSHLSIVGWYHTHPNFGIFLSDRDRFIHENFFSGPGQIALVIDPVQKTEGIFTWRAGKTELAPYYWVGNRIALGAGGAEREARSTGGDVPAAGSPTSPPLDRFSYLGLGTTALQYVVVFLLGYLLAGRLSDYQAERLRSRAVAETVYQLALRPGLETRLSMLRSDLATVGEILDVLPREHLALLKTDDDDDDARRAKKEAAESWQSARARLERAQRLVNLIETHYSLSPRERQQLQEVMQEQLARAERDAAEIERLATPADKSPAPSTKGRKKPAARNRATPRKQTTPDARSESDSKR